MDKVFDDFFSKIFDPEKVGSNLRRISAKKVRCKAWDFNEVLMDSLAKFTDKIQKFYEFVESHESQIQNLLKEAKKPLHSIANQSAIFRAVADEGSVKNTSFEKFHGFRENLIEIIFASLQEEFDRLDAIRCKINSANEDLHREQALIENQYLDIRKKGLINSSNLNPCCPSLEHIIGWTHDIWCYYHSLYLQLAQAVISLNYEDENSVKDLTEAFKEDFNLKRAINYIRAFNFSKFEFTV